MEPFDCREGSISERCWLDIVTVVSQEGNCKRVKKYVFLVYFVTDLRFECLLMERVCWFLQVQGFAYYVHFAKPVNYIYVQEWIKVNHWVLYFLTYIDIKSWKRQKNNAFLVVSLLPVYIFIHCIFTVDIMLSYADIMQDDSILLS